MEIESQPMPSNPSSSASFLKRTFWFIIVSLPVGGLLLMPLPDAWHHGWRSKLLDLGHVPLFLVMTIILGWFWQRNWWLAAFIATVLAGGAELIQGYFDRNGDWEDFWRGVIGIAIALIAVQAWSHRQSPVRLSLAALLTLFLLAWPLIDLYGIFLDLRDRRSASPVLADFGNQRQMSKWLMRQANLYRIPDPERPGHWIARLEFLPGAEPFPGAMLFPATHDWSAYQRLCCRFSVVGEPLHLAIMFRDFRFEGSRSDRYEYSETYAVGSHVVELDLKDTSRGPWPNPLDLSNICLLQLFIENPKKPRSVLIDGIWLE